ncbi:tetratricopeptide repeat protein [Roseovarius pelagicus]|uniref:Ancillary SecYEG translocon subunit/Cell division coordinator CpoB TPR domain-containing protein n=1 Tax=Roseovarius pelagicus TaxID=2980108 RepID=A0ABY6DC41_9RHOB|nr:tetratricopeptide repeat protein [Roseovarius pelagicus]UXX83130.1 hypothetical protein N7U68_18960 [Roseovarius pelagicus]
MSNTDSFIDEVTEEVRRDRLFGLMRRYGWIAVLAILVLVGGATYNEWQKARARAQAEALGDSVLAALTTEEPAKRVAALDAISAPDAASQSVVDLLAASEEVSEAPENAARRLLAIADRNDVEQVYRQIATLKAVMIPASGLDVETRRARLDGLALGSGLVRLLAEEQLAYLDVETGDRDAAIERLQRLTADAGATPGLRRRVSQVIVALGGVLDTQTEGGTAATE